MPEAHQGHPPLVLNEVTPSIRSFAQAIDRQRQGVERIPILAASRADLVEVARALDAAEVAVLAIRANSEGGLVQLREAARAVSVPVLRADPLHAEQQIYESRLAWADAVLFDAGALGDDELLWLCEVARSTHMAAVVNCRDEGEVRRAALARAPILLLRNPGLFSRAGRRMLLIAESLDLASLRGQADALFDLDLGLAPDPAARFTELLAQVAD